MPVLKEQIDFSQKALTANRLRMFVNHSRRVANLIKLERYGEAELYSARFTGILRAWDIERERGLDACLKK